MTRHMKKRELAPRTTWHAVADGLLVKWGGPSTLKTTSPILLPKNSAIHQDVIEVEVLAVGSVAAADVEVGDIALTRIEGLTPVSGDVWRLSAGLVLGLRRSS